MKTITKPYICGVCGQGYKVRKQCLEHEALCEPVLYFKVPDGIEEFSLTVYRSGVWLKEANSKNLNAWDSGQVLPKLSPDRYYAIIGRIPERPGGANFAVGIYLARNSAS